MFLKKGPKILLANFNFLNILFVGSLWYHPIILSTRKNEHNESNTKPNGTNEEEDNMIVKVIEVLKRPQQ